METSPYHLNMPRTPRTHITTSTPHTSRSPHISSTPRSLGKLRSHASGNSHGRDSFLSHNSFKFVDPNYTTDFQLDDEDLSLAKIHEEKIKELEGKIKSLEGKVNTLTLERDDLREKQNQQEMVIKEAHTSLYQTQEDNRRLQTQIEVIEINCTNEINKKNFELERKTRQIEELSHTQVLLETSEQQAKQLVAQREKTISLMKANFDKLRAEKTAHDEKPVLHQPDDSLINNLKHQIELSQGQNLILQKQVESLKTELSSSKKRKLEVLETTAQIEKKNEKLNQLKQMNQELHSKYEQMKHYESLVPGLKTELAKYQDQERQFKAMQTQCENLIKRDQNIHLQEEKIFELQKKIEKQNFELHKYCNMQAEYERILAQHASLEQILGSMKEYQSATQIKRIISELQQENKDLLVKNGDINAQLTQANSKLERQTAQMEILSTENQNILEKLKTLTELLQNKETIINIISREKSGLQNILATYDAEDALLCHYEPQKMSRIKLLEQINEEKLNFIQNLQSKVDSMEVEKQVLVKENKMLDQENHRLNLSIIALETALGGGEYDPRTTKILHLKFNPSMEDQRTRRNAKLTELEEENKKLKSQITSLENGEMEGFNLLHENEQQKQNLVKIKELEKKYADSEKSRTRFIEIFQKKMSEFKTSLRQLFGFRIEFQGETGNLYQLYPTCEKGKESYLMFKYDRTNDTISLCASTYATQWTKEVDFYLGQCHSYPGFLAAVTLSLLNTKK